MAVQTGTYQTFTSKGLREDLENNIYNISPQDTPFMSSAGRGRAKGTLHEWQTDALAAAVTTNAVIEGDEYSYTTPAPTVRVGNYTQIMRKEAIVSGTLEAVDKAGRQSQLDYEMAKKAAELKLDQEKTMLFNQAADAGGSSTPRKLAGLGAWLKTNVDAGVGGGNPVYASGVPNAARTDGTLRAFTETILKNVIQSSWTNGGKPRILMVGPVNKQRASGFSGIATRSLDVTKGEQAGIIGAADLYASDFGVIRIIPDRLQRERDGWLFDPSLVSVDYLRPYFTDKPAKTGDAVKEVILTEFTLRVKQEAGLGLAADLTTT